MIDYIHVPNLVKFARQITKQASISMSLLKDAAEQVNTNRNHGYQVSEITL